MTPLDFEPDVDVVALVEELVHLLGGNLEVVVEHLGADVEALLADAVFLAV